MPWRTLGLLSAIAAVLAATPSSLAEGVYAGAVYPWIQAALTSLSNLVPLSLFDGACVALFVAVVAIWWSGLRRLAHPGRRWRAAAITAARTAAVALAAFVWFQIAWGLNYARPPVDARLGLTPGAPTADEVARLLVRAVAEASGDYALAHAAGFPGPRQVPPSLVAALHDVEAADGRPRPTVPARPKLTLLAPYFRMAGVDGLTAPAMLETLLNPDLTGPERPFVLAHEWAHLAGYAPEADASFVAWRTTQQAGPAARYSGWLFLLSEAARQVPAETRRAALAALDPGPRADLEAIRRRAEAQVDVVQRIGWRVYDGYLRSQGVTEGLRSYSRVVELIARSQRPHHSSPAPPPR